MAVVHEWILALRRRRSTGVVSVLIIRTIGVTIARGVCILPLCKDFVEILVLWRAWLFVWYPRLVECRV